MKIKGKEGRKEENLKLRAVEVDVSAMKRGKKKVFINMVVSHLGDFCVGSRR